MSRFLVGFVIELPLVFFLGGSFENNGNTIAIYSPFPLGGGEGVNRYGNT